MIKQRGFAPLFLLLLAGVLLVGIGLGYFVPRYQLVPKTEEKAPQKTEPTKASASPTVIDGMKKSESQEMPQLSQVTAVQLANDVLGPCECQTRSVTISQQGETWHINVTDDGLQDDSIKAYQTVAPVFLQNGQWRMGDMTRTQQCWPGRGHQVFSTASCQ